MIFWGGYERAIHDGDTRRIWVRRAKCTACRPHVSHALVPAFLLPWRFYAVGLIGPALARMAAGKWPGSVAFPEEGGASPQLRAAASER